MQFSYAILAFLAFAVSAQALAVDTAVEGEL
jgi:hypothetical protein